MEGQVIMGPMYDGVVACDALPVGEMGGCGAGGCDGGCDSFGGDALCGEPRSPQAWRPCVTLCVPQDGWASFEYLGWFQSGMDLPPLVTTSVNPAVDRDDAGVLGQPSTQILFGGDEVLDDWRDGGRLRVGVWLDRRHHWGIGGEYFGFDTESERFSATSEGSLAAGDPILARPFFNTVMNGEDSGLIAFGDVVRGTVSVAVSSELEGGSVYLKRLRGSEAGCSTGLFCGHPDHFCDRTESTIGYRGLELNEHVRISENTTSLTDGSTLNLLDRFETRNQFNGFDIGWGYKRTRGYWSFDSQIRLAVGNTRQTVTIDGRTTINDQSASPATTETYEGGLLAQSSNIGTYRQDEFTVVPEFNANIGYQLTDHLRATVGYTFIYWSNLVRPGDHISRDLNPNLLPPAVTPMEGALRPGFAFDTTDYWAQGISFGGEYRW